MGAFPSGAAGVPPKSLHIEPNGHYFDSQHTRRMKHLVFQALADAARAGEPVALALISGVKGSSPQKIGAKALFYPDGRIHGTLGGGCLEAEIQQRAIEAIRTGQPAAFDLLLDHDFGWDDGLICGGKVLGLILPHATAAGAEFWTQLAQRQSTLSWGVIKDFSISLLPTDHATDPGGPQAQSVLSVPSGNSALRSPHSAFLYAETIAPPCNLWIAGAGHIAQAVAPLAAQLDFNVTVFDDRPALANHHYFPKEISIQTDVWEKLTARPLPDAPGFALIVTRGHRHDALVLAEWIHQPFLFLGMIGSARKARMIFEHFRAEKIATEAQLARVACPVGIKIKSQSVQEIAVSIMAQFIEKRAELVNENAASPAANSELV